jgi:acetyltransferase
LNATFTPGLDYKEGRIGFVCQSGGYSSVILNYGTSEGVGFSKIINVGNNCDVSFADVLEFLATDKATEVIILYMEGFKDKNEGRRFYEVAKDVAKRKPIVAFKAGRTKAGRRAVQSHSGSLAGSDELYTAAFKQARIIRASSGIEMIDIAKCLSLQQKFPAGNKVAILTNLGGPGVVATDICEGHGLELSEISRITREKLAELLSFTASFANPIDLAADWPNLHLYKKVLSTLMEDEVIDCIIIIVYIAPQSDYKILIEDFTTVSKKYGKPIVACCLSKENTRSQFIIGLEENNIPCYKRPEQAAEAMVSLAAYSSYLRMNKDV